MEKNNYCNLDEYIYEETLPCGLRVFLYPNTKSKNFYITLSTKYGSNVQKYQKGKKIVDVLPGSAHFLEHRVCDVSSEKRMKELEELGSFINAYTTYELTNYNIMGANDILKNIEFLFEEVYNVNLTEAGVEKEKGIIKEEIDMVNDRKYRNLSLKLVYNLLLKSPYKIDVIGNKEAIDKTTSKRLQEVYNDFYVPNNMFMIVTGNFEVNEVIEYIREYSKKYKKSRKNIKIIEIKEPEQVDVQLEEIELNVEEPKLAIGFKVKDNSKYSKLEKYLFNDIFLTSKFGATSDFFEEAKQNQIKFSQYSMPINGYILFNFSASSKNIDKYKSMLFEELKNKTITKETFERKKKNIICNSITSLEDITQVEDNIVSDIIEFDKIQYNLIEQVKSLDYKRFTEYVKSLDFSNYSIVVANK